MDQACVGVVAGDVPTEAGEDRGQALDVGVGVGRDGLTGRVELLRSIVIQLIEADGEELHDFARVVLVGIGGGVAFVVAEHGEHLAHHRVEGHVLKQCAEVAEGILAQQVVVVGFTARHALDVEVGGAGDDDTSQ